MKTYNPHPKQEAFHKSPPNKLLYGGARGPGMSHELQPKEELWFYKWLKRTHPHIELMPWQIDFINHIYSPEIKVPFGFSSGKTFIFNLIEQFSRDQAFHP